LARFGNNNITQWTIFWVNTGRFTGYPCRNSGDSGYTTVRHNA
jgi:hypothetical protein